MGAALAIVETQVPAGFDDWLATGRALLEQRNEADWKLADWLADGKQQFGNQLAFDMLGEQLGIAPKRLKTAVKVAQTFPPALRAPELSFDVHREIARVEPETRLKVLRDAAAGRWNEKVAHERVENIRIESGAVLLDDDPEHREVVEMIRAWNRMSSPEVREYAWPYFQHAARSGFTTINMAEVSDD